MGPDLRRTPRVEIAVLLLTIADNRVSPADLLYKYVGTGKHCQPDSGSRVSSIDL
jgi:hypothetical protein